MAMMDQRDLLYGMGMIFVKDFIHIATREYCKEGHCLFNEGEPASRFYTLIEGGVKLSISDRRQKVYLLDEPGEMFGWSSLVGGEAYTASAVCTKNSSMLKFDKNDLGVLLEKQPEIGFLFYKKLSQMLGKRLMKAYDIIYERPELRDCDPRR